MRIRSMGIEDVDVVARMDALDHDPDLEKGYVEAKQHTLDHLEIVPRRCYVVENDDKQIVAAMVLHPREDVFEIEDFHVKEISRNKEAFDLLRTKLTEYIRNVQTEALCCPYALRRLVGA